VAGGYRADAARTRAHACTVTPRVARRLRPGTALWDQVTRYLKAGYSPEQIAGTLALVHADPPSLPVSHETIYTALYAMPRGALRTDVIGWLRFGHAKQRARAGGEDQRGRIPDRVSIHDRPPEVEARLIPGLWEGDLIKGAHHPVHGTVQDERRLCRIGAERIQPCAHSSRCAYTSVADVRSGPGNVGASTAD